MGGMVGGSSKLFTKCKQMAYEECPLYRSHTEAKASRSQPNNHKTSKVCIAANISTHYDYLLMSITHWPPFPHLFCARKANTSACRTVFCS